MKYYEQFTPGETCDFQGTYLVTEEESPEVGHRWDPQPFHVDPAAAADSVFGGLVASSVHLFAILTSLGVEHEPVAAVSSLGFRTVDNHAPARPDDVLHARGVNLDRKLSQSRPDLGVVTVRSELLNQHDELVFSFENAALIECRPGR